MIVSVCVCIKDESKTNMIGIGVLTDSDNMHLFNVASKIILRERDQRFRFYLN